MSRWEVFKQDAPGKPHQAVGSVHATDARHALINAAHVFVRRPAAVSLWVAPASVIYSRTAQELAAADRSDLAAAVTAEPDALLEPYEVFRKSSNRRSMTFADHVGTVEASSAVHALQLALAEPSTDAALAWWIVPAAAIAASDPADTQAWFEPARDKLYKQQSQYGSGPTSAVRRSER